MSIYGIGTDILGISRMEMLYQQYGERLLIKILAPAEQIELKTSKQPVSRFLAKRFAIKEAFAKALGTGLRYPATCPNIWLEHDKWGKPMLAFSLKLQAHLHQLGIDAQHVSISDEAQFVCAMVVLETNQSVAKDEHELEIALAETQADLAAGRFSKMSAEAHIKSLY